MRDEGNVVIGFLGKCDFDLGIAVVNVTTFLDVQVVLLNHHMVFLPYSKVVAVGRGISGKLMATSGMLTPDASGSEDSEDLMLSTCKISEVNLHCDMSPHFNVFIFSSMQQVYLGCNKLIFFYVTLAEHLFFSECTRVTCNCFNFPC